MTRRKHFVHHDANEQARSSSLDRDQRRLTWKDQTCFTQIRWFMSEFLAITAAAAARIIFAVHGIAAIWRVALVYKQNKYWFQAITLFGIPVEFFVTLYMNNGHEWKWFCPSVFFYLCTVIPSVWFLELDLAERRSKHNVTQALGVILPGQVNPEMEDNLPLMPWKIAPDMWAQLVEQTLLLVLIIGRWLLPVGKTMTRDQLSQLLLVYIGTAADIIELFESFKEQGVQKNLTIVHLILAAWSISLMQFTLVVTATKTRKPPEKDEDGNEIFEDENCCSCRLFWETELWALSTTILLQDGPFLCLRLGLIIHYKIISQSNIFFTTKNLLVVVLQLYRVCVIIIEHRKRNALARLEAAKKSKTIKVNGGRKRRIENRPFVSNGNMTLPLASSSQQRWKTPQSSTEQNGNTDPLSRRYFSSSALTNSTLLPPPVPTPRPTSPHSRSSNTVNFTTNNVSTDV